jgi:acyl-CoA synthetase (AMP-forming)/AMP-acid ligase II/alkylation response protein AidB-like acyl-CoA dehydrogenase/acyl carrier protein
VTSLFPSVNPSNLTAARSPATLVDLLQVRSTEALATAHYAFVDRHDRQSLTYAGLDQQARSIAAELHAQHQPGDRILLSYPPGLDFIAGFFGCLYAGMIAVPVYPPRRNQRSLRLQAIIQDAQAQAVLTHSHLLEQHLTAFEPALPCYATDLFDLNLDFDARSAQPDDIAFLQYTSGSTGKPKGVIISHHNLLHNLAQIHQRFAHSPASRGLIWLPPYHDMGLIGGILQPLYGAFPVTLMAPTAMLQKPLTWLDWISRDRATTSGGPNFAYELCCQKITPEQIAQLDQPLDLSSWRVAFIGAEPIRRETLDRFAEKFVPYGFERSAFYPCYGLAEATLFVTGSHYQSSKQATVSCGQAAVDQTVIIVDPDTRMARNDGTEGEIWIAGESVAQGYWQKPEVTAETFAAVVDTNSIDTNTNSIDTNNVSNNVTPKSYLRSGDLGLISQGELYITGRIKDLIVIRGQNYHPQDIEQTIEQSHPALAIHAGVAFGATIEGQEQLVVMQEIQRTQLRSANFPEIEQAIRTSISTQHQLQVAEIILLKPSNIPKTSSGKIQRHLCKAAYQQGKFQRLNISNRPLTHATGLKSGNSPTAIALNPGGTGNTQQTADRLIDWLRDYGNHHLNSRLIDERRTIPPYVVLDFGNQGLLGMQVDRRYGGLGLDHRSFIRIVQQLGAIDPTLALFVGLNNVLGIRPIKKFAPSALREELLPLLATGRELAAFALTEPGAGSNPQAIRSQAMPNGDGYQINGHKIWSGSAAWAGVINIFVQQYDRQQQPIGISGYVLRRGTPGLCQGPEALTMGMRGMVQNAIDLENVAVNESQLLGEIGAGMAVAQDAMMYGRVTIAAACIGGMKRCAQLMLRYSAGRSIATGKLIEHPILRDRFSQIIAMINGTEALVNTVAQLLDSNQTVPPEVYAACKITAPEYYWQTADWLVQSLGGRGYIEPNLAPQILRDARVLRIFEGSTETLCGYLGAIVCQQPQRLLDFVRSQLAATEVADRLAQTCDHFQQRHAASLQQSELRPWLVHHLGELVAIGLVWAASSRQAPKTTQLWAQQQFEHKYNHLMQPMDTIASSADILVQMRDYQMAIGEIEQTLAGEDTAIDSELRLKTRAVAHYLPDLVMPNQNRPLTPNTGGTGIKAPSIADLGATQSSSQIQTWLTNWLSQRLKVAPSEIDPNRAFADYGIDSVMAVELAQELEEAFNLAAPLDVTIAWNFPTIQALANYIKPLANLPDKLPPKNSDTLENLSEKELTRLLAEEIALSQAIGRNAK